jgi:hypothetical protein
VGKEKLISCDPENSIFQTSEKSFQQTKSHEDRLQNLSLGDKASSVPKEK